MQISQFLVFLILFPLITALFMVLVRRDADRNWIVRISALVIGLIVLCLLFVAFDQGSLYFAFGSEQVGQLMFVIELLLAVYILYVGIKHRKLFTVVLILLQAGLLIFLETGLIPGAHFGNNLLIDQLSIIMAMIIGIIGSLICVYSLGYMETYHIQHAGIKDRRKSFFFWMFVFLSAMFGLVFSNNLLWVFFFWEITTFCSFVLIGYSQAPEATTNAFLALSMNLLGGVAFIAALVYLALMDPSGRLFELNTLVSSGYVIALVPAVLISFPGITKAALMPFSSWLVGAMVAPTPVSALLHSSTMVKAGVYIIIRFAPVLSGTTEGLMIALVGGITFLLASFIAISQSNAKKYSLIRPSQISASSSHVQESGPTTSCGWRSCCSYSTR